VEQKQVLVEPNPAFLMADVSVSLPDGRKLNCKFSKINFFRGTEVKHSMWLSGEQVVTIEDNRRFKVRVVAEVEELR
jgi:hypothetical protein